MALVCASCSVEAALESEEQDGGHEVHRQVDSIHTGTAHSLVTVNSVGVCWCTLG